MTETQARKRFQQEVAPSVLARYGKSDKPACREAWAAWTDSLHRDGVITKRQSETWSGPKSCVVRKVRKGQR
jgi:hypothetical protein